MQTRVTRRTFFKVAGGTVLTTALTGCFGFGSSQTTGSSSSSPCSVELPRTIYHQCTSYFGGGLPFSYAIILLYIFGRRQLLGGLMAGFSK